MTLSSFFTCRHPDQWQMRNIIQIRLKIRMKRAMDFSTCKILSQYLHITIKVIKISRTIMSIKVTTTFVSWLTWSTSSKSPLSTGFPPSATFPPPPRSSFARGVENAIVEISVKFYVLNSIVYHGGDNLSMVKDKYLLKNKGL